MSTVQQSSSAGFRDSAGGDPSTGAQARNAAPAARPSGAALPGRGRRALPAASHWRPRRTRRLASAGSSSRPIPRRGDGLQRPLTGGGRVPLPQAAWQAAVGEPGTAPYGARRSSRASEAAGPGRLKARSREQITDTALASSASGTPSTGTRRGVRGEDLGGAAAAGSTAALDRCRRDAAVGRRARIAALGEAVVGEVVGSGPRGGRRPVRRSCRWAHWRTPRGRGSSARPWRRPRRVHGPTDLRSTVTAAGSDSKVEVTRLDAREEPGERVPVEHQDGTRVELAVTNAGRPGAKPAHFEASAVRSAVPALTPSTFRKGIRAAIPCRPRSTFHGRFNHRCLLVRREILSNPRPGSQERAGARTQGRTLMAQIAQKRETSVSPTKDWPNCYRIGVGAADRT